MSDFDDFIVEISNTLDISSDFSCSGDPIEEEMAKLKQKDTRDFPLLNLGDLVAWPGAVGEGVVVATDSPDAEGTQQCFCIFAARGVDLRRGVQDICINHNGDAFYMERHAVKVPHKMLKKIGTVPSKWLTPLSTKEINNNRFLDIMEEDNGSEPSKD